MAVNGHPSRRQFFCESECLCVEKTTYVKKTNMRKGWPLTATLLEERGKKMKFTLIVINYSNFHI
jgi:hypothetical protein